MSPDLYRVNFVHRGQQHSLLTSLTPPPSVGDHLNIERLELVVTGIRPAPSGPATILAVVEDQSTPEGTALSA